VLVGMHGVVSDIAVSMGAHELWLRASNRQLLSYYSQAAWRMSDDAFPWGGCSGGGSGGGGGGGLTRDQERQFSAEGLLMRKALPSPRSAANGTGGPSSQASVRPGKAGAGAAVASSGTGSGGRSAKPSRGGGGGSTAAASVKLAGTAGARTLNSPSAHRSSGRSGVDPSRHHGEGGAYSVIMSNQRSMQREGRGAGKGSSAAAGTMATAHDAPSSPRSPRLAGRDALSSAMHALWDPSNTEGDVYKPCELAYNPQHPTDL
jgi:hypothetical protein